MAFGRNPTISTWESGEAQKQYATAQRAVRSHDLIACGAKKDVIN